MYNGYINFRGNDFVFTFSDYKLRLIPAKDKFEVVHKYLYKEIGKGFYTLADPVICKEKYLKATTSEGQTIIFLTNTSYVDIEGNTLIIGVDKYILFNYKESKINKISFTCPEINHIYKSNQLINDKSEDNRIALEVTQKASEKEIFNIVGKEISVYFGYSSKISYKVNENPLDIKTTLDLEFEATDNYEFINRIINIVTSFIGYLYNRKNIIFSDVYITTPYNEEQNVRIGKLYIQRNCADESNIRKDRFISYEYIKGHIGDILQDIEDNVLYIRHIPNSYEDGKHIDAASFVMITACFEWTFKQLYPEGIDKNERTIKAEEEVTERLDGILEEKETTGKKRELYKRLKNMVSLYSLSSEIRQVIKDYKNIIDIFSEHLENLNKGYSSARIGDRLAEQRNNFAHGNLDKEFNGDALTDIILLKRINYIMQLKKYGIDDLLIKKAINELFGCNISN